MKMIEADEKQIAGLVAERNRLTRAMKEIVSECESRMGEWAGVQLPYLPENMTGYYHIVKLVDSVLINTNPPLNNDPVDYDPYVEEYDAYLAEVYQSP